MNTITDYLNLPFIEVLKHLMKDAVKDCLAESGVLANLVNASSKSKKRDPEGLTAKEALEFLNENGYPMKKGQLYKETSKNTIPHWKFNNKLHFKEAELLSWAEGRLVSGKAVGVLKKEDRPKKKVTMFASDSLTGRSMGAVCPLAAKASPERSEEKR